jgi:hypothetical protein
MSVRARTAIKPRSGLGGLWRKLPDPLLGVMGIASRRDREGVDRRFVLCLECHQRRIIGVLLVPLGPGHIAGFFYWATAPRRSTSDTIPASARPRATI